ncbi:Tn3 family transposase [Streptomyces sp. NPDC002896]|uniref:Tn3 family transposase n=1 Tax=Streptomyces sp. NPDC002896 TaxID=3154438 RepID=UPI003316EBCF
MQINTLLLQQVLAEPAWAHKLTDEDRRGLTALFWSNINPYGTFRLDMDKPRTPPVRRRTWSSPCCRRHPPARRDRHQRAMDNQRELTDDEANDLLDGGERDAGWDPNDEYEWGR